MLTEICAYLKNWFDVDEFHRKYPQITGTITIENNTIIGLSEIVQKGQYFRIYGSIFNDGVHQYTTDMNLKDETFVGVIQSMRIDPDLLKIAAEIQTWADMYCKVGSEAMSPFNSESFGGYSYSKSSGYASSNGTSNVSDPISVFASRLNRWRKL